MLQQHGTITGAGLNGGMAGVFVRTGTMPMHPCVTLHCAVDMRHLIVFGNMVSNMISVMRKAAGSDSYGAFVCTRGCVRVRVECRAGYGAIANAGCHVDCVLHCLDVALTQAGDQCAGEAFSASKLWQCSNHHDW